MVAALFDTNILIDYLKELDEADRELSRYERKAISVISRIEVLVGASAEEEPEILQFLAQFEIVPLDENVAELAVILRRQHKMRLPDAIIWASARANSMLFVTRNIKDFPADNPGVRIPYRLDLKKPLAR